ncbi:MAG: hypothetical protein ABFS02_04930 [Pseudomonadota bacterium]
MPAVVIALVGWSASNFGKVSIWLMLAALAGIIIAALIGEYQRKRMNQLLEEIENA